MLCFVVVILSVHRDWFIQYNDVTIGAMASQITRLKSIYSSFCSRADQRKHQSSTSLAFVMEIHRWPVNSPHKGPVMRKMFPFDDVFMCRIIQGVSMVLWQSYDWPSAIEWSWMIWVKLLLHNYYEASVQWIGIYNHNKIQHNTSHEHNS